MTVAYMKDAATATPFSFHKLLFRWKGSVWKLVINELCVWLYIYFIISFIYRFVIVETDFESNFVKVVKYVDSLMAPTGTSVTFVLGFYVSIIATRWWKVFMAIPWPDTIALTIAAFYFDRREARFKAEDQMTRCTVIRYLVLSYVLVFRDINERIRKRFPTLQHLAQNLATTEELRMIAQEEPTLRYWMPIEWILLLMKAGFNRKQIAEDHYKMLIEKILEFRTKLQNLQQFDFVNVPLAYTQVVNVAVFTYFGMALIAKQYIGIKSEVDVNHRVDYAIPFFTILEFLFYVGWLKVAQVMLNPFGLDDDDFDIDLLVERNLNVGLSIVDDFFEKHPPLVHLKVTALPHTIASAKDIEQSNPMRGSVAQLKVPKRLQRVAPIAKFNINNNLFRPPRHLIEQQTIDIPETPVVGVEVPTATAPSTTYQTINEKAPLLEEDKTQMDESEKKEKEAPANNISHTGKEKTHRVVAQNGRPAKSASTQLVSMATPTMTPHVSQLETAFAANSELRRAQSRALSQDRGRKEEQERYRLMTPKSGSTEATTQISTSAISTTKAPRSTASPVTALGTSTSTPDVSKQINDYSSSGSSHDFFSSTDETSSEKDARLKSCYGSSKRGREELFEVSETGNSFQLSSQNDSLSSVSWPAPAPKHHVQHDGDEEPVDDKGFVDTVNKTINTEQEEVTDEDLPIDMEVVEKSEIRAETKRPLYYHDDL
ncbi:unnamed protein product, partial [Mesorhabditis belari]|uniref:Bestrophin homolog n=1 Tax=Mesorhabditis belari TaxID=2138241 RepID=A0AAF3ESZ6_9BILA